MSGDTLRTLADDYVRLPDFLPLDTAERIVIGRQLPPTRESKVPLRTDVSDLLAAIGRFASECETGLRQWHRLSGTYWTVPTPQAVPASLRWSADILDRPPVESEPLPYDATLWVTERSETLRREAGGIVGGYRAPRPTACPRCEARAFYTSPLGPVARCVACGLVEELGDTERPMPRIGRRP